MPVEAQYIENGIVVSHWSGHVTYEELTASQKNGQTLIGEIQTPHVLILHLERDAHVPIDIQKTRELMRNAPFEAVLVSGHTPVASLLGSVGKTLVRGLDFEYLHTLDEAILRAREILAENG